MNRAAFLQQRVKVFYHLACMGNWQQVFSEQMKQLKKNGFSEAELTILGSGYDLRNVKAICRSLKIKPHVVFSSQELACFERPALLAVEDYARKNDGYILYLHSKGVSSPDDESRTKWRRLMMRELIDNWKYCVERLYYYDVIGVNWRDMPPISHFSGNFWYASTQYLRKLPDFKSYYDNPLYNMSEPHKEKRKGCEFWLGSYREKPHVLSLGCRNVDFCNEEFWRNKDV